MDYILLGIAYLLVGILITLIADRECHGDIPDDKYLAGIILWPVFVLTLLLCAIYESLRIFNKRGR